MNAAACATRPDSIGRRADEIFPPPLGQNYRAQDDHVLKHGGAKRTSWNEFLSIGRARLVSDEQVCRWVTAPGASLDWSEFPRPRAANEGSENYARVAEVVRHIQTHFSEPLRVRELAARAGLSAYQFEQRVRKIFQPTAGQADPEVRMENAVSRLRETDEAIAAIALECGYSDQSAFTRQFRQAVGLSPGECRRAFRQTPG